jgi:hypothetical protein
MFVSKQLDAAGRGGGCWGGTKPDHTLLSFLRRPADTLLRRVP